MLSWYLIHTKPRQEKVALENLERQGFECYLPMLTVEKVNRGALARVQEALFPRYLFIRLNTSLQGQSWAPIRSTRGVSRLVCFGRDPARVGDDLVQQLQHQASDRAQPQPSFQPGDRLRVTQGPFQGLEAVFQMTDGERRVMVLIDIMSRSIKLALPPGQVQKLV